jgi:hypothetical protein
MSETLRDLETAIREAKMPEARDALRRWLSFRAGPAYTDGESGIRSFLEFFSTAQGDWADVAAVAIRCAHVQGLYTAESTTRLSRSIVSLTETHLPRLAGFLKLEPKGQTFEKYSALTQIQKVVSETLEPLRTPYGDLHGVIAARKVIIGGLSHGILRAYLKPFGLDEVRQCVESLFGVLSNVTQVDENFLDNVESCQGLLKKAFILEDTLGTFLSKDYFGRLLNTIDVCLQRFLEQMRGSLSTQILLASPDGLLKKRYPVHEEGRTIRVSVPLRNTGPGSAIDVRVSCESNGDDIAMDSMTLPLGTVVPGEFEVFLNVLVLRSCSKINFAITVEWGEIGSPRRKSDVFIVEATAQSSGLDWPALEYSSPYSTDVAEGDAFVGRQDMVQQLAAKILRAPMEPFYITGQKRIGKTSLAKAAVDFAKTRRSSFTLHSLYVLWGNVADVTPSSAMRRLGESIHEFITDELPAQVNATLEDYASSLSGLIRLADIAGKICSEKRFVVILDEIDEMHEQLYLSGTLAETFFGNLRALSRCRNICLVLVGGENMPYIMDRQGQKLNNFSRFNLSSFDRAKEWDDFCMLVQRPSEDVLTWHKEAISEIYNTTSGNPYFAKLICAGVFRKAVGERDADVTAAEVRSAVETEISMLGANSFSHLWQDGIFRAHDKREPDVLRRRRVLVASARCLRGGIEPTLENIAANKATSSLPSSDILPVLNDFVRRGVMVENQGVYSLTLPIFRRWLVDVGAAQLVADALSEEIADAVFAQENAALVTAKEIADLVGKWPTYRGRKVGTDEVRAWLEQVPSKTDQRILFKLLNRMRIYSEPMIREKLGSLHGLLRQSLPIFVQRSRNERRQDILITYLDGVAKSGANYASLYAEENKILASLVVSPEAVRTEYEKRVAEGHSVNAIVMVDDIAGTGKTLANGIESFVSAHRDILIGTKLRILAIAATPEGQTTVLQSLTAFEDLDIDFRVADILPASERAFGGGLAHWDSADQREYAESLCRDLGAKIYREQPFGFGGLGLLIGFPTTVPNNTLPIVHSAGRSGDGSWKPLLPRPVN